MLKIVLSVGDKQVIDHTRSGETLVIGLVLRRYELLVFTSVAFMFLSAQNLLFLVRFHVGSVLIFVIVCLVVICWYFYSRKQISSTVHCPLL